MENRPEPPISLVSPANFTSAFQPYTYFSNEGLPAGRSYHGMFVLPSGPAVGIHSVLNIQGAGALTWACITARNECGAGLTANYRLDIIIDGTTITNGANVGLVFDNGPGNREGILVYVGILGLDLDTGTKIRGADSDYYPFEKSLVINGFKSRDSCMSTILVVDYIRT